MALSHPFRPTQVGKGREREKIKIIVPLRSYPTRNRKFQRNSKKFKIVKKYRYGFISSRKQDGKGGERDKIKIIVTFNSYPMCNFKKIQKFKKCHYGFISSKNRLEKDEKQRK